MEEKECLGCRGARHLRILHGSWGQVDARRRLGGNLRVLHEGFQQARHFFDAPIQVKPTFFIQVNLLTIRIRLDTLLCMHKRLDIAEYLDNEEIVAEYLNMVSESDDPALFLRAIGHIARSKGMSQIAEKTGLGRESLYKALDEKAHPRFETIFKVLNAMGIQMTLVPKVKFRKRRKQTELCVAEKRARYRV